MTGIKVNKMPTFRGPVGRGGLTTGGLTVEAWGTLGRGAVNAGLDPIW